MPDKDPDLIELENALAGLGGGSGIVLRDPEEEIAISGIPDGFHSPSVLGSSAEGVPAVEDLRRIPTGLQGLVGLTEEEVFPSHDDGDISHLKKIPGVPGSPVTWEEAIKTLPDYPGKTAPGESHIKYLEDGSVVLSDPEEPNVSKQTSEMIRSLDEIQEADAAEGVSQYALGTGNVPGALITGIGTLPERAQAVGQAEQELAEAKIQQANEQAQMLGMQALDRKQAEEKWKARMDKISNQVKGHVAKLDQDIQAMRSSGTFTGMDALAIGIGGYLQVATGSNVNIGLESAKARVNSELEKQKSVITGQSNLLTQMRQIYGDEATAVDQARKLMYLEQADEMERLSLRTGNKVIAAQAKKLAEALKLETRSVTNKQLQDYLNWEVQRDRLAMSMRPTGPSKPKEFEYYDNVIRNPLNGRILGIAPKDLKGEDRTSSAQGLRNTMTSVGTFIDAARKAKKLVDEGLEGNIRNSIRKLEGPQAAEFATRINSVLNEYVKSMSGLSMTNTERENYEKTVTRYTKNGTLDLTDIHQYYDVVDNMATFLDQYLSKTIKAYNQTIRPTDGVGNPVPNGRSALFSKGDKVLKTIHYMDDKGKIVDTGEPNPFYEMQMTVKFLKSGSRRASSGAKAAETSKRADTLSDKSSLGRAVTSITGLSGVSDAVGQMADSVPKNYSKNEVPKLVKDLLKFNPDDSSPDEAKSMERAFNNLESFYTGLGDNPFDSNRNRTKRELKKLEKHPVWGRRVRRLLSGDLEGSIEKIK